MAKDDHSVTPDTTEPFTLIHTRHRYATLVALLLAGGGGLVLHLAEHTRIWNLGLTMLVGACVVGVYAGYLDASRITMGRQAEIWAHAQSRFERAAGRDRETIRLLRDLSDTLETMERREMELAVRIEDLTARLARTEGELAEMRERMQELAGRVADWFADDISRRRRSS